MVSRAKIWRWLLVLVCATWALTAFTAFRLIDCFLP